MAEEPAEGLFPMSVGERLRAAREAAGLDLNDIATRTRIPLRHLSAVERSDYAALPSPTYALGFVRAYARAAGADAEGLARDLRGELGREPLEARAMQELADPARIPSRLLAWTAALVALAIVIAYAAWRANFYGGPAPAGVPDAPAPAFPAATPAAPAAAPRQATLIAIAPVWLRVTDASGATLLEKELAAGERYDVPQDANGARVRTGAAEALRVLVDGRALAPLGPPATVIKDVAIDAAALAARPATAPLAPATPANR